MVQDSADPSSVNQLFVTREYQRAGLVFLHDTVMAVAKTRSPVLGAIAVERDEFVPPITMTVDDGSVLRMEPKLIETEFTQTVSKTIHGDLDEFHLAVDTLGQAYADQVTAAAYEQLAAVTGATGQTVDGAGRDRWEVLVEGLEKVEWAADDDGVVHAPAIHMNPLTAEKFSDPPSWVAGAIEDVRRRKQEEWDARRRHRRLPRRP